LISTPPSPPPHFPPLRRLDPRPALIGRTESVAARPEILAVPEAVAVRGNADAGAAHARDGLRGPDDDLAETLRGDSADQGLLAGGVEGALVLGVVVGGVDYVDGDVVVWEAGVRILLGISGELAGKGGEWDEGGALVG